MTNSAELKNVRGHLDEATVHLRAARILLDELRQPNEQTLFLCKCAAESALKGFLEHYSHHFDDTEGLTELLAHAHQIEPEPWRDSAHRLASCQHIANDYFEDDPTEVWDDANAIVRQVFEYLSNDLRLRNDEAKSNEG